MPSASCCWSSRMSELTLIIGNKNYSSWSLRAWIALKQTGKLFKEIRIPIHQETSLPEILKYSPSGRVPCLIDGDVTVWESLAICEYLAERFPKAKLWPQDPKARAYARAISHEMHAGFQAMRKYLPMDCRADFPAKELILEVTEDVNRITEIWKKCRSQFTQKSPFLFGDFTIADAMYAPVVIRFRTYHVPVDAISQTYMDSIFSLPALQEWLRSAAQEVEIIA